MTAHRGAVRALTIVAVAAVGGVACGSTYVEPGTTARSTVDAGTASAPPASAAIDPDAPIAELLDEISTVMADLDQRIVDGDGADAALARIDALWDAAERRIRSADPDDVFNFEQAIELARTAVERRRPADATKGYRIFLDVTGAYVAR